MLLSTCKPSCGSLVEQQGCLIVPTRCLVTAQQVAAKCPLGCSSGLHTLKSQHAGHLPVLSPPPRGSCLMGCVTTIWKIPSEVGQPDGA